MTNVNTTINTNLTNTNQEVTTMNVSNINNTALTVTFNEESTMTTNTNQEVTMKYSKSVARLTLANVKALTEGNTTILPNIKDRAALQLAAQQRLVQLGTDLETNVSEALTSTPEVITNPVQNQEETQMNTNQVTGRIVLPKTPKEANRSKVIRYLNDAISIYTIGKALITRKGDKLVTTGIMDQNEVGMVQRAIQAWFKDNQENHELVLTHQRLVDEGRLSLELGNLDLRIVRLTEVYLNKALVLFNAMNKTIGVNGLGSLGIYAKCVGSQLHMQYTVMAGNGVANNRWNKAFLEGQAPKVLDIRIDASTFSDEGVKLLSRIVWEVVDGRVGNMLVSPYTFQIDAMQALMLATASGMEPQRMSEEWVYYGVDAMLEPKSPLRMPALTGLFGVTPWKKLKFGYACLHRDVAGWCERTPEGFRTIEVEKHDGVLAPSNGKVVARIEKLHKEGLGLPEIVIPNALVVNRVLEGNEKYITDALCTGVVWCANEHLLQHGQVRVVSTAAKLGVKGTLAPISLISPDLEARGYTLLGFGSSKGKSFGVQNLPKVIVDTVVDGVPTKLECYTTEAHLLITNHYLINCYRPASLETVLNSWADANGSNLDKALSLLEDTENPIFTEWVRAEAHDRGLTVPKALKALEAEGSVVRKSNTTTLTPTEFDVMATYLGTELPAKLINELVWSPLNKGKVKEVLHATQLLTGHVDKNDLAYNTFRDLMVAIQGAILESGVTSSVLRSGAPSREFLVHFVNALYKSNTETPRNVMLDAGNCYVVIPAGKFFEGQTFKSSVYLESVVASGFISRMLPKLAFAYTRWEQGKLNQDIADGCIASIKAELEANMLGKDLGRLKCVGGYHVLSIAPWAKEKHHIYISNQAHYCRDDSSVMVTKHPALFDESHTQAEIIPLELDEDVREALGDTMFVHPDMLLALQND